MIVNQDDLEELIHSLGKHISQQLELISLDLDSVRSAVSSLDERAEELAESIKAGKTD